MYYRALLHILYFYQYTYARMLSWSNSYRAVKATSSDDLRRPDHVRRPRSSTRPEVEEEQPALYD